MFFSYVYGHEGPVAFLRKSLERNRVAQGYLFHGMSGVGKKTTALAFAQALNCLGTEKTTAEPCASCRKIDAGNHPDVLTVAPRGLFIKIDDIRDLGRRMSFRPLEARRRVVIIEEAHAMNSAAANALLKTLEEPASGNILILLTDRYDSLPATILSRCRKIRFAPLPVGTVEAFLRDRKKIDDDEAVVLAASSGGSIGRALNRNPDQVRQFKEEVISLLDERTWNFSDNPLAPFSVVEGFGEERTDVEERLDLLGEWLRDVLVCREMGSDDLLMHRDLADVTRAAATGLSRQDILKRIEAVHAARLAVQRNGNRQLVLESMLFKFLFPAAGTALARDCYSGGSR